VPYGNAAFLDGEFHKPDEIFVALGAEYFAKYTAKDALTVLDRRQQSIAWCFSGFSNLYLVIADLLRDVDDEIDIYELTKKLKIFDIMEKEEAAISEQALAVDDESALDIREDWTPEDEQLFVQKNGRSAHFAAPVLKGPVMKNRAVEPKKVVKPPTKAPLLTAVKERIVERKSSKPVDPSVTATTRHIKESLFRKTLLRDAGSKDEHNETFAP